MPHTGRWPCAGRATTDAGSATLELVVLAPGLLILLLLIVAAGRISSARQQVDSAARQAARAASLQRDATAGHAAAVTAADTFLRGRDVSCQASTVAVHGEYAKPAGQPGAVRVTVSCTTALGDVAVPGLPGSTTLNATYAAPLDIYRGR